MLTPYGLDGQSQMRRVNGGPTNINAYIQFKIYGAMDGQWFHISKGHNSLSVENNHKKVYYDSAERRAIGSVLVGFETGGFIGPLPWSSRLDHATLLQSNIDRGTASSRMSCRDCTISIRSHTI